MIKFDHCPMERKILKNEELNNTLIKQGYIVLDGIDERAIQELINCYESGLPSSEIEGFQSTHFYKDSAYKKKVNDEIVKHFDSLVSKQFCDYRAYFGNFMVKDSGLKSEMPLHADWTYVDEEKFVSIGLWCPLVDTSAHNGRLGVVPYSHLFPAGIRGPQIKNTFREQNEYIAKKYGKFLDVKAGQVVLYNHKTLHFSLPNLSNEKRIALNLVCIPEEAQVKHYARLNNADFISYFEPKDHSFFLDYSLFGIPKDSPVSEEMAYLEHQYGKKDIDDLLAKSWWQKIMEKFGK